MSTYKAALPSVPTVDPRIPTFFQAFYATSDDPSDQAHLDYANSLTRDGTLMMGIKEATGYDKILELRKGLWSGPIKTRKHHVKKIFPFDGEGAEGKAEVMLYGFVEYGLKNGKEIEVNWSARAVMVEEGQELKMKFYQVYLVSLLGPKEGMVGSDCCEGLGRCGERRERLTCWSFQVDNRMYSINLASRTLSLSSPAFRNPRC